MFSVFLLWIYNNIILINIVEYFVYVRLSSFKTPNTNSKRAISAMQMHTKCDCLG